MTVPKAMLVLLPLLLLSRPAHPDEASASLDVTGSVLHPGHYTPESLAQLPSTSEQVMFFTGHGNVVATMKGVTLWQLLSTADIATDPKDKDPSLRKILVATGADGYRVAVALAEIDPKFGGGQAMVAFQQDGKPLGSGLRLIVPGDKAAGRNVSRLVRIEVTDIK